MENKEYEKLLKSLRLLHTNNLLTENEYLNALKKLYLRIGKENRMCFDDVNKYIESIWWTCGEEKEDGR